MHYSSILEDVIQVTDKACERVLHIYQSDFKVSYKEDESPITAADIASHDEIVKGLRGISRDIPILSEEGVDIPWEERRHWRRFWLIDPVDGTKEFTQRTGEFTVNIALFEDEVAVLGVVTVPARGEAYWESQVRGLFSETARARFTKFGWQNPRQSSVWSPAKTI